MPLTKSDRRAIIWLAALALAIILTLIFINRNEERNCESAPIEENTANQTDSIVESITETEVELQTFDPNTVDSATLIRLGLKPHQARSFLKYRNAGAIFRQPIDIARVYVLEDEDIDRLLPLIRISPKYSERRTKYPIGASYGQNYPNYNNERNASKPDSAQRKSSYFKSDKFTELTKIDPNTADTTLLKRIPGIGSKIAKSIVDRRSRLGGFNSINQLLEINIFSPDLLEWFKIDESRQKEQINRIRINSATFNQLMRHPYIGYDKARDISQYIRLYGKFEDEEQLKSTNIFTTEELSKIVPYLDFK